GRARLRAGGCGGLAAAVVVALRATSLRCSLRAGGSDGASSAPERRSRLQPSRRSAARTSPPSTALLGVRRCASTATRPQPCTTEHGFERSCCAASRECELLQRRLECAGGHAVFPWQVDGHVAQQAVVGQALDRREVAVRDEL